MKYKYLNAWVCEEVINLDIRVILRYQDQYMIKFYNSNKFLQLSMNQGNSFLFVTQEDYLPWTEDKQLDIFNHNLGKAKITGISIYGEDRIYFIEMEKRDIFNENKKLVLICELATNFENLILCERVDDDLIIIDSLKKFSFADNNQRQIIPKTVWQAPNTRFIPDTESVNYNLAIIDKKIIEGVDKGFASINELFEKMYYEVIISKKIAVLKKSLLANLNQQLKKNTKKLRKQEDEYLVAQDEEKWFQIAELLKSSIHKIKKGMHQIIVNNYFETDFPEIVIPLQVDKSPRENCDHYYKKYKKAKTGIQLIAQQITKTKAEIISLNQKISEIEQEDNYISLVELTKIGKEERRQLEEKVLFRRIKIDDNWEIFIGRSSKENDLLTCKVAKSRDWWFHTRVFQGTHVVLRNYGNKQLPDKYRLLCARLAAYYSKAKKSENVPVDYTQIRYVRKPRGSAPGYVTYKNQRTLFVDPIDYRQAINFLGINHD